MNVLSVLYVAMQVSHRWWSRREIWNPLGTRRYKLLLHCTPNHSFSKRPHNTVVYLKICLAKICITISRKVSYHLAGLILLSKICQHQNALQDFDLPE